jgi:hypothetical protein
MANPRKIAIRKVGNSTIVDIKANGTDISETRTYNKNTDLKILNNVLHVKHSGYPVLFITFDQLEDDLGASNLEDWNTEASTLYYFTTNASNSGGGGDPVVNYNTATAYDTVGDLPITFATGTIHSISILCITGELTISISGEETVLIAGQNTDIEATTLIIEDIEITSCTGTFLATTLS